MNTRFRRLGRKDGRVGARVHHLDPRLQPGLAYQRGRIRGGVRIDRQHLAQAVTLDGEIVDVGALLVLVGFFPSEVEEAQRAGQAQRGKPLEPTYLHDGGRADADRQREEGHPQPELEPPGTSDRRISSNIAPK